MFDVLEVSIQVLAALAPVEVRIRRKSLSLAKQLARASESISLNLGEGMSRCDGDKRRHYEIAAGSASDTGSQPSAFASVMMIGIMIIVRTVLDVVSRWLYIISAINTV